MSSPHLAQPSPARKLLTQTHKQIKALATQVRNDVIVRLERLREASRPVRRRSQYPSLRVLHEAVEHVEEAAEGMFEQYTQLKSLMKEVRDKAKREQYRRSSAFPLEDED